MKAITSKLLLAATCIRSIYTSHSEHNRLNVVPISKIDYTPAELVNTLSKFPIENYPRLYYQILAEDKLINVNV